MRRLLAMMGGDPAREAAAALLASSGRVAICTGFPVAGRPETDGPPGAIALARALHSLGRGTAIASWREALDLVAPHAGFASLVEVPRPCDPVDPPRIEGVVVAVEACGRGSDGVRRSMRGADVTDAAPRFEDAFGDHVLVAIGDGGNEIGMGSAPDAFFEGLPFPRPTSTAGVLVPATVSDWGALAVVAELSRTTGRCLLPTPEEHAALVRDLVARGAVDGFSGRSLDAIDGRPLGASVAVLERLRTACGLP